jgi:predicted deacylase
MSTTLRFELPRPVLGGWRYGNTGVEGVWHFTSANPGPTVMVSALLHGNELCGAWAVCDALQSGLRPRAGSLVFAFCNLDAFDCFDAAAPDASRFVDEDMNRVWGPAVHRLDAGSRERHRARQLAPFVERADLLLDLHSMHEPGAPLLLTGTLQRRRARGQVAAGRMRLARRLEQPRRGARRPGSLPGAVAGRGAG